PRRGEERMIMTASQAPFRAAATQPPILSCPDPSPPLASPGRPGGARRGLNLAAVPPDVLALAAVDRSVAERLRLVPVQLRAGMLTVVMADANDVHAIDELARLTGCRINAIAAPLAAIELAIARFYNVGSGAGAAERPGTGRAPESVVVLGEA